MNSGTIQGRNRTYTYNYGAGPNGQGGAGKVTVENQNGKKMTFMAAGASNGEQSVGGVARYNHQTGRLVGKSAAKGPNGAAVGGFVAGPNGFAAAGAVAGPEGVRYGAVAHGEDFHQVWKGYA
jgi:hypothetical protein